VSSRDKSKLTRCKMCLQYVQHARVCLLLWSYRSGWIRWGRICRRCAAPYLRAGSGVARVES